MMKRMMLLSVLSLCSFNITAMSIYNSMSNGVVSLGQSLDNTTIPIIGNLANVLPFTMISAGLQKCPGQTVAVAAGLLFYILSQNEAICAKINSYKDMIFTQLGMKRSRDVRFDDTLFIFDGEDEEDAEEQTDLEDELLTEDEEYSDAFRNKKRNVKFL